MTTPPSAFADVLWHRLRDHAERQPNGVAVFDDAERVTNAELLHRVVVLAQAVRERAQGGSRVGVCLQPGVPQHVALLATLVASCTYVPLDAAWSQERTAFICADAELKLVLAEPGVAPAGVLTLAPSAVNGTSGATSADPPTPPVAHDCAVYVMYTSGTTGVPKGVETGWPALRNRLDWMQALYPLDASDVVAAKTSCGFDVSMWEHLWPAMGGASVAGLSVVRLGGWSGLHRAMDEMGVTVTHFVPSVARALLDDPAAGVLPRLRFVALSGEVLDLVTADRVQRMAPEAAVYNMYGPTECAIDVSYWRHQAGSSADPVPVGAGAPGCLLTLRPIGGFAPEGPYELVISGVQVAPGYVGVAGGTGGFAELPGLGASYLTGDRAERVDPGGVSVSGRLDRQTKINGVRVELDGVEAAVRMHPSVLECAAVTQVIDGRPAVVVAYVRRDGQPEVTGRELTTFVRTRTAMEAVSLYPRELSQIPLTVSGKTDYTAIDKCTRVQVRA